MAEETGNGGEGDGVDILKVLRAIARALSSLATTMERLEGSNADLRARVDALERNPEG